MPRFSLIVPVHKVQGYLPECLDSVLGQDYVDFELIAVNDCSPDGSGAILDEYARHDARIHVMHLTENVGLGRARNAGMERAQGDYVLFLDSDDTLTEGALTAIADRLDATDDPEVLVYDYARTYWNGRVSRNQRADLLRDTGPDVFSSPTVRSCSTCSRSSGTRRTGATSSPAPGSPSRPGTTRTRPGRSAP